MSDIFRGYKKKHEYLVCIDSDGCAMNTMDLKHKRCFGPCMVEEWGLKSREKEALIGSSNANGDPVSEPNNIDFLKEV